MKSQDDIAHFVREGLLTQAQVYGYQAVVDLRRYRAKKQRRSRTRMELRDEFSNAQPDELLFTQTVRAVISKKCYRHYAHIPVKFLKADGVPFVKVGKRDMCRKADLLAWMERHPKNAVKGEASC